MAYSTNPITVERMAQYLTPLQGGGEVVFKVEPKKARWLTYRLHEALRILQDNPGLMPEVPRNYRIETTAPGEVVATPKVAPRVEVVVGHQATVDARPASGIEDIINRWNSNEGDKLYLANAGLTEDQLVDLYEWATEAGVVFFESAGALTLMPHNPEVAPFAWTPEDLDGGLDS